ncbi:HTTM domain-containing protein [Spelaeicoccus albus]|uniref:HTTM-like domain-containing protein n=1 Tax=Spelaeicoccus albus TaxID=1280376 RepID=A0A7Z0D5L4_9MICO|nr:HTTM domain-containing protein [Spelaeicoccus albus]NYI69249.1 hypothetical protein [Spelaeicoccus albus]
MKHTDDGNDAASASFGDLIDRAIAWSSGTYKRAEGWLLDTKHGGYGTSVARIVYGVVLVLTVLVNFPYRQYIWGDASGWAAPLRVDDSWGPVFGFFSPTEPGWALTIKLLILAAVGIALIIGWHTRTFAIAALYLYISLVAAGPTSTDQADNAFRIMLFYFCFTDMSRHWSLDARRHARRLAAGKSAKAWSLPQWLPNTLNNLALIAIAYQLFIIYVTAGLSKVQGNLWERGTAIYYPLQVDKFMPWPWVNDLLVSGGFMVGVVTYFSVFIQIFFPLLLLVRWTRVIGLLGILAMHVGIGLFMGLGLFSLTMVAADVIFISDRTYAAVERWCAPRVVRLLRRSRTPRPSNHRGAATSKERAKISV